MPDVFCRVLNNDDDIYGDDWKRVSSLETFLAQGLVCIPRK